MWPLTLGENLRKIAMDTTNEFVTALVNANLNSSYWQSQFYAYTDLWGPLFDLLKKLSAVIKK